MNNYFNNYDKKFCNGCGTCALKCPNNAITMVEDMEGFIYPKIDKEKCINCGLCKKVCSNINDSNFQSKAYIAINKSKDELNISSSGGMFYLLAKYVIENNGVVFGVAYDKNLNAIHKYAKTLEDCKQFCGSKYVRSDLKNTYNEAKQFLEDDKMVLFTGTACQLSGLKKFLGKKYENLILCDILCHANPSPKVFDLYKKNIETKYSKKIIDIRFRTKENGWKNQTPIIQFDDGTKIEEKSYFNAFVKELINRPSCYECVFASKSRITDFTIGDFWGIEKLNKNIDISNGVSLLIVNSSKAEDLLNIIKDNLYLKEVDINLVINLNHFRNVPFHKNRNKFYKNLANEKINEKNIINAMNKFTKTSYLEKIVLKLFGKINVKNSKTK